MSGRRESLLLVIVIALVSCTLLAFRAGSVANTESNSRTVATPDTAGAKETEGRCGNEIRGLLVGADGSPIDNAEVRVLREDGPTSRASERDALGRTDVRGRFALPWSVDHGNERPWILASCPGWAHALRQWNPVTAQEPLILVACPPSAILGFVRTTDGSSLGGVRVSTRHGDGPEPTRLAPADALILETHAMSEGDGRFCLRPVRHGLVDIEASSGGRSARLRIIVRPGAVILQDVYVDVDALRDWERPLSDLSDRERSARLANGPDTWTPEDLLLVIKQATPQARRAIFATLKSRIAAETGHHPPVASSLRIDLIPVAEAGLEDPDEEVRGQSLSILCYMNHAATIEILSDCLSKQEWRIRYFAAMGLGWLGRDPEVHDRVCSTLRAFYQSCSGEDATMRAAIASALQDLGESVDPEVYYQALRRWDADPVLAAIGLAKLGRTDAIELILRRLERSQPSADFHLGKALSTLTGRSHGSDWRAWQAWYSECAAQLPVQRK